MKVARAKLREIGPDDVDMEEYKVRDPGAAVDPWCCGKRGAQRRAALAEAAVASRRAGSSRAACVCAGMLEGGVTALGVSQALGNVTEWIYVWLMRGV